MRLDARTLLQSEALFGPGLVLAKSLVEYLAWFGSSDWVFGRYDAFPV